MPTHLNISTNKTIEEVRELADAENWRVLVCNRAEGLFQLVEVWVENSLLLELMTPEQTARYIEITQPDFMKKAFEAPIYQNPAITPQTLPADLNLIG